MNKQKERKNLIDGAVNKYNEALDLAAGKHLNLNANMTKRFIIHNLLDWVVSQASLTALAEYRNWRDKNET